MSRRQCSSTKLMALQVRLFFFVIHSFFKFAYALLILPYLIELSAVLSLATLNQHVIMALNYFTSSYFC